jgi:L-ascorbate metabolism protein UlaG (beta-lactamase superfamily)
MGNNIVYVYQSLGVKIVHMGETDLIASPAAVAAVRDADVILAYAGQYGTVKNPESFRTLFDMNIRIVIPQHYSNIPERIFYGEPAIPEIVKAVPEGIKVSTAKELLITKGLEVQFLNLMTWYE